MLLASYGSDIKFHKWPSGDYHSCYQIPDAGFSIPSMSWCSEGEMLVTTVPSLGPPILLSVGESGIQTHQVIDIFDIQSASFSRTTQKNIAFGKENGEALIYDVDQKCTVVQLPELPSAIKYLEYGAHDTTLAAGCKNGQICLYNSKYNVSATFYVPNCNSLSAMSCHARQPHLLAAASNEGIVVVWDTSTGNTKLLDKYHSASTTDVAFSSGSALASVGLDEKFIGYDLRTKDCIFSCTASEKLSAVSFMPASDEIAVGTIDGKLLCYDMRSIDHPLHTLVVHHPKAVGRIAFQNTPFYVQPTLNEVYEMQQQQTVNKNSKSNLTTTVVYNKTSPQSHLNTRESIGSFTQNPSTINTIAPDTDSEFLLPNSEEFAAYLENLQFNNKGENGGDGDEYLNQNESNPPSPLGLAELAGINRLTTNILNRFPFTTNSSYPNNPPAEEDLVANLDDSKTDGIDNWIKKVRVNTTQVNVLMDQDEDIAKLRMELQEVTKEALEQLVELINREFLKVRMAVSRGFVQMESKMNARWAELNQTLLKMRTCIASDEPNELQLVKESEESVDLLFPAMRFSARSFSKPL